MLAGLSEDHDTPRNSRGWTASYYSSGGQEWDGVRWTNDAIEAHFGPLRTFVIAGSDHPNHTVLAAQRCERARIRSERDPRGRPAPHPAA
ncbi:hypothetical protein GCM10027521_02530 [Amycolatopsis cihanbeyliensis]